MRLALLVAAVALLAPASAQATYRDFRSPSGKVGCAFYSDAEVPPMVRCDWRGADDEAHRAARDGPRADPPRHRHGDEPGGEGAALRPQHDVRAAEVHLAAAGYDLPEPGQRPRLQGVGREAGAVLDGGRKWVYDFSEGSKDMRELLGGKGANVAEMTRVLGEDRVPAGFTITTEACVAYMKDGQTEPDGMAEQVEEALERLQETAGKTLGDDEDPLLVSVRSRRARVDAGHARHGPQPRPQRHLRRGPGPRDRERALRLGLLPALRADVRQRLARHPGRAVRGRDQEDQGGPRGQGRRRSSTSTR